MRVSLFLRSGLACLAVGVASAATWNGIGPVVVQLTLPTQPMAEFEPLLSVGRPGHGDVVVFRRLADGRVCFGWEQVDAGCVFSAPVEVPVEQSHHVMLSLGSLLLRDSPGELAEPLRTLAIVQFDGKTVLTASGDFESTDRHSAVLGQNIVGGALAKGIFSGTIKDPMAVSVEAAIVAARGGKTLLEMKPPEFHDEAEFPGPVRIKLKFPKNLTSRNEPLVVTGVTGRGDILFVRYEDESHIRIGFDHWLVGGPLTPPIPCDYGLPHELTISLGSLLAPAEHGTVEAPALIRLRSHCLVQFDGKTVIAAASGFHPTTPEQITLGANRIGGSTAESLFYGEILRAERVGPEIAAAALGSAK